MRWLFLLFVLAGCEAVPPEGRFDCVTDDDCPEEMLCRVEVGSCYLTPGDAGVPDDGS